MIRGTLLRATAAVSLLASLLIPIPARSSLRVVPDQFSTIQSALNAASSGDSIMVRAGLYTEALSLSGKDVTLFGEADSGSTAVTTGGTARILDVGAGVTAATLISHLMFRNGLANKGAAIRCTGGASPLFRGCEFVSNVARGDDTCSYGGAMFLEAGSLVRIEDCLFLDNLADASFGTQFWDGSGGALAVWNGARVEVRRSRFERNRTAGFEAGGWGGAVILIGSTSSFEDCVFADNAAAGGGAILARAGLTVVGCTFAGNSAGAISCAEHSVAFCSPGDFFSAEYWIEGSVFHDNGGGFSGGAVALALEGRGTITRNTLAFNAHGLSVSPDVAVDHNIVARNAGIGIGCQFSHPAGSIVCNDVWSNGGGNYAGACPDLTGVDDNLSLDPLFCDEGPARDLGVRVTSPCTEENSTCGAIGAPGTGCGVAAVFAGPMPHAGILLEPVPNPTAGTVTIGFILSYGSPVRLEVYDPAGRHVAVLADRWFGAGRHEVVWSGALERGVRRPGVYLVVMRAAGGRQARRALIVP